METRNCLTCRRVFSPNRSYQKYCRIGCRQSQEYLNHQKKEEPWKQKTPRGNRGTVSELLVCSDLLIRGYYVFRNISPHGPCDLVALKSEKLIRVEVKGSYERKDGTFRPSGVAQQIGKDYDVLAYTYMGKVSYEPEIE